jgi:hypothetical protein
VSPSRSLPCSTTRCASTWTSRPGRTASTTRPRLVSRLPRAGAVPGRRLDLRRLRLPRHGGAPPLRPADRTSTSIEQVQYTGAESITSSSNKIQLNFNHPVKELQWVVQRDSFVDCSTSAWLASVGGAQPFNYSDDFCDGRHDHVAAAQSNWRIPRSPGQHDLFALYRVRLATTLVHRAPDRPGPRGPCWVRTRSTSTGRCGVRVGRELPAGEGHPGLWRALRGQEPRGGRQARSSNGQDRFTEREGAYFDKVQPYQHHSRSPSDGHQRVLVRAAPGGAPAQSGTCNFSRIDKATLQLTVSLNTVTGHSFGPGARVRPELQRAARDVRHGRTGIQ